MNQIEGTTGIVGGGITVSYNSDTNNFIFLQTVLQEETLTIKVRGAGKFGLDNVDLGVGTVPQILI